MKKPNFDPFYSPMLLISVAILFSSLLWICPRFLILNWIFQRPVWRVALIQFSAFITVEEECWNADIKLSKHLIHRALTHHATHFFIIIILHLKTANCSIYIHSPHTHLEDYDSLNSVQISKWPQSSRNLPMTPSWAMEVGQLKGCQWFSSNSSEMSPLSLWFSSIHSDSVWLSSFRPIYTLKRLA